MDILELIKLLRNSGADVNVRTVEVDRKSENTDIPILDYAVGLNTDKLSICHKGEINTLGIDALNVVGITKEELLEIFEPVGPALDKCVSELVKKIRKNMEEM